MVALGGAIGAVLRYTIYRTVDTQFPWATFIVNIVGCTLAAYLMFSFSGNMDETAKCFLFVGIFGAFTTFSTFSIDTVNLVVDKEYLEAAGNFVLNALFCVGGGFLGWFISTLT